MFIKNHVFKLLFGSIFLVVFVGCTVAGLAYGFADRLILQEISSRYALNNAQEVRALHLIRKRLYEHQQEEMPLYENWLQDLRTAIKDQLTRNELHALSTRAESLLKRGVEKTLPLFADLLAGLSPAQIAHMREEKLEHYAERAEEIAEENQSGEAGQELIDRLEEWLGKLSKAQRQLVKTTINEWPDTSTQRLQWRRQRFLGLVEFLNKNPPQNAIHRYLHDYWLENKGMAESMAQSRQQSRQNFFDLLVTLDTTLSPQQRKHVLKKIDEWLSILRSLQKEDIKPENT